MTFVSSEKIKTATAEGLKAIYAFADVTKIRLNQQPNAPAGSVPGVKMGGSGPDEIRFRFSRQPGGASVVTLVFPEVTPEQVKRAQSGGAAKTVDPQALSVAKLIMKDLRLSIVLQVAGRIIRTNSPHVQGPRVTLLDMDFNELASDATMLQKLQGVDSLEQAKIMLKGVKGFTFNFEREVTVEFAERSPDQARVSTSPRRRRTVDLGIRGSTRSCSPPARGSASASPRRSRPKASM